MSVLDAVNVSVFVSRVISDVQTDSSSVCSAQRSCLCACRNATAVSRPRFTWQQPHSGPDK